MTAEEDTNDERDTPGIDGAKERSRNDSLGLAREMTYVTDVSPVELGRNG